MAETDELMSCDEIKTNISALSHRQRKAIWKKEKRKLKRQAVAQERDEKLQREEEIKKNSPNYAQRLAIEEEQEKAELLQIEAESRRQHELWEWHEEMYKQRLKEKEEQAEREKQQRLEIEKKIKEEWEERQKKEKEEEEERKKKKEKQVKHLERWNLKRNIHQQENTVRQRTEELLKQARDAENKDSDWSNPLAPVQYGKERQIETCPFFAKVAACRFGDRCSRAHPYPDNGRTLLFSSMFRHFQLDQGLCEEYDTDIVLEYEDSEVYQKFKEFYEDVLPEFKAIGHVVQFKVCCNFQPHLRGNVYVSYTRVEHALEAYAKFNARWYGGKQISAQFVDIPSWRRAICGLFGKGRCPKGKECNFLHVFRNPNAEFQMADRDMEPFTPRQDHQHKSRRSRSRDRKYSPSRSYRKFRYSRSRSRSQERHRSYKSDRRYSNQRSRSPDRQRSYRSRQKSRSPRYRSHSSRQRSRSPSRKSTSHRSNISKYRDKSRSESSESDSSSRENTPLNARTKVNRNNDQKKQTVVDILEENGGQSEEMVWVEKSKDTLNNKDRTKERSANRNNRCRSSSEERSGEKDIQHRSNSDSDSSQEKYGKRRRKKKSKKKKTNR